MVEGSEDEGRRGGEDAGAVAPASSHRRDGSAPRQSLVAPPPDPSVKLTERERTLLRPQVAAYAASLSDPALSLGYSSLLEGIERGGVAEDAVGYLENLLELGLQTGRFRHQFGPIDAQVLYRLYCRTPRGLALASALNGVNEALAALEGQVIDRLSIAAKGPGEHELTIETDQCRLAVAVTPGGVHLVSVETGV